MKDAAQPHPDTTTDGSSSRYATLGKTALAAVMAALGIPLAHCEHCADIARHLIPDRESIQAITQILAPDSTGRAGAENAIDMAAADIYQPGTLDQAEPAQDLPTTYPTYTRD